MPPVVKPSNTHPSGGALHGGGGGVSKTITKKNSKKKKGKGKPKAGSGSTPLGRSLGFSRGAQAVNGARKLGTGARANEGKNRTHTHPARPSTHSVAAPPKTATTTGTAVVDKAAALGPAVVDKAAAPGPAIVSSFAGASDQIDGKDDAQLDNDGESSDTDMSAGAAAKDRKIEDGDDNGQGSAGNSGVFGHDGTRAPENAVVYLNKVNMRGMGGERLADEEVYLEMTTRFPDIDCKAAAIRGGAIRVTEFKWQRDIDCLRNTDWTRPTAPFGGCKDVTVKDDEPPLGDSERDVCLEVHASVSDDKLLKRLEEFGYEGVEVLWRAEPLEKYPRIPVKTRLRMANKDDHDMIIEYGATIGYKVRYAVDWLVLRNIARCFTCQRRTNHLSDDCKRRRLCPICGESHEPMNCTKPAKCANCGGAHKAWSESCPYFIVRMREESKNLGVPFPTFWNRSSLFDAKCPSALVSQFDSSAGKHDGRSYNSAAYPNRAAIVNSPRPNNAQQHQQFAAHAPQLRPAQHQQFAAHAPQLRPAQQPNIRPPQRRFSAEDALAPSGALKLQPDGGRGQSAQVPATRPQGLSASVRAEIVREATDSMIKVFGGFLRRAKKAFKEAKARVAKVEAASDDSKAVQSDEEIEDGQVQRGDNEKAAANDQESDLFDSMFHIFLKLMDEDDDDDSALHSELVGLYDPK